MLASHLDLKKTLALRLLSSISQPEQAGETNAHMTLCPVHAIMMIVMKYDSHSSSDKNQL